MDKREEEVLRFSVQIFLSHSTQKLRRGSLLCSRKILVSKNVRDKRGGEYHNFPSKLFCFSVPKTFVGESFSVSLFSGIEKLWIRGGKKYRDFPSKVFFLTMPKVSVGESFTVALISGTGKVWIRRGSEYQDFPSKIFCLTV